MNRRILVTYATRAGSTATVAAAISEVLKARGFAVDLKPVTENPALAGYRAVVIGSAINGAQWLPEAVDFVRQNQGRLSRMPVALFCVHIMNLGNDEKGRSKRLAYLNAVRPLVRSVDEAFFAGVGKPKAEQSLLERWASQLFGVGEGDCRDWNQIRGWAQRVAI